MSENAIRARFGGPQAETPFGKRPKTAVGHWEKGLSRGVYESIWKIPKGEMTEISVACISISLATIPPVVFSSVLCTPWGKSGPWKPGAHPLTLAKVKAPHPSSPLPGAVKTGAASHWPPSLPAWLRGKTAKHQKLWIMNTGHEYKEKLLNGCIFFHRQKQSRE